VGPVGGIGPNVRDDRLEKERFRGEDRLIGPVEEARVGEEELVLLLEAANASALGVLRMFLDIDRAAREMGALPGRSRRRRAATAGEGRLRSWACSSNSGWIDCGEWKRR
jgi:hypothetical protein